LKTFVPNFITPFQTAPNDIQLKLCYKGLLRYTGQVSVK